MRHAVRGPLFVLCAAGAVLLVTAVLTHGFRFTRSLVEASLAVNHRLPPGTPFDIREETLVGHAVPLVFALATGIVLVTIGRLSLRRCGWRYWSFLVSKTIGVVLIVPLLWIETGRALRAHIPHEGLLVLVGGLGFTLIFIIVFGCALVWVFADQRRRCPICLQLLVMPVTIGSWTSVFEPAATELLCEDGHGSLCVADSEDGEPDRWITLDASWRDLFAANPQ